MIGAFFLIGIVSMAFLLCLFASEYIVNLTIRQLRRHTHRQRAAKAAWRAFVDEYRRSLKYERLAETVLERS